jgi:hypothetical protein
VGVRGGIRGGGRCGWGGGGRHGWSSLGFGSEVLRLPFAIQAWLGTGRWLNPVMDQAGPDAYLNPNLNDRGNVEQVGWPFYVFFFPLLFPYFCVFLLSLIGNKCYTKSV